MLADRLGDKGRPIDLVLAHHPHGIGTSRLDFVMRLQPEHWAKVGVPIAQAESAMAKRLKEVHSPIGLDIEAETPEEIAISIIGELVKERAGLREKLKG